MGPVGRRGDVYTHGHDASVLRAHDARTVANSAAYLVPDLRSGISVLDVGCGGGSITADLAGRVAPGLVVGVDPAPEAVASTRERSEAVRVATASGYRLPFADDTFDVVHAHQVLQHLSDAVSALVEMRRVCRPDGVVAVRDADYAAMTRWPPSKGLDLARIADAWRGWAADEDSWFLVPHSEVRCRA